MNAGRQITTHIIIFLTSFFAVSSVMAIGLRDVEIHDSLEMVNDSRFDLAYLLPGADLGKYNKIILEEVDITFKRNWKRDQNRKRRSVPITDKDMEEIISEGKELFMQVFTEVLEKGGYSIVTQPGEDVLLIRPSIFDLDITAPDLHSPGRSTTFTETAGSAKLSLELYDSTTDQILFQSLDKRNERAIGLERTNSVTNRGHAIRALKYWAGLLRYDLE